ncbi:hypothetical protein BJ742DRAFT_891546 [Cladochytrium replicatum]|nr:hypothetical protein BJ742DRAFT_891546 [Cladochytrium replicatum]
MAECRSMRLTLVDEDLVDGEFKTVDFFVEVIAQQLDSMLPYHLHNPRRLDDKVFHKNWTLYDYVPWDKANKHFAYPDIGIGMIYALPTLLGADRGKVDIQFTGSQVQDTCTTPKVNFRYSFAEYYQHANINSARKWREWRLAENLRVWRAQSSTPFAGHHGPSAS